MVTDAAWAAEAQSAKLKVQDKKKNIKKNNRDDRCEKRGTNKSKILPPKTITKFLNVETPPSMHHG
jgi:hypothetical protein